MELADMGSESFRAALSTWFTCILLFFAVRFFLYMSEKISDRY